MNRNSRTGIGGSQGTIPVSYTHLQIAACTPQVGVVNGDGVAPVVLDQTHAGDIGGSVPDVDHVLERHGALLLLDIAIDQLAVEDGLHSLVDFEDELRLVRVIHRNGGPIGDAVDIVEERAGVNLAEFVRDGRPLDDLLEPRRVDVVQDLSLIHI